MIDTVEYLMFWIYILKLYITCSTVNQMYHEYTGVIMQFKEKQYSCPNIAVK